MEQLRQGLESLNAALIAYDTAVREAKTALQTPLTAVRDAVNVVLQEISSG
jgi:exonuclease VII small subunit